MEFEEIKKVWDARSNKPMYVINENVLHDRVLSKKKQGFHITNISELLLIIVNGSVGCFILGLNMYGHHVNIAMYLLAAWMFGTALFLSGMRLRRLGRSPSFDRSIRGDLEDAIAIATYQVRLSHLGRWNILPVGLLTLLGVWEAGKPLWIAGVTLVLFILANYAAGWEHRIYKTRKRGLLAMRDKLDNETLSEL